MAWIWNVASGEPEHRCERHQATQDVKSPGRPTARRWSIAHQGDKVSVWNTSDGTLRKSLDVPALDWPRPVLARRRSDDRGVVLRYGCKRLNVETGDTHRRSMAGIAIRAALSVVADRLVTASSGAYGVRVRSMTAFRTSGGRSRSITGAWSAELSPDGTSCLSLAVAGDSGSAIFAPRGTYERLPGVAEKRKVRWLPKSESLLSMHRYWLACFFRPGKGLGTNVPLHPALKPNERYPYPPTARGGLPPYRSDLKKVEIWDLNTGEHLR